MKNLRNIIIFGLSVLSIVTTCFSDNSNINPSCTYLFSGNTDLGKPYNSTLVYNSDRKNIKDLTQYFCDKSYSLKCSDSSDGSYSVDYFDASQSVFLSILCESVLKGQGYAQTNSYLKKQDFIDFNIVTSETGYQEKCHRYGSMNNCDYSYNLPLIFNEIMNDFFSIKQARNFGITGVSDMFSADEAANKFSLENFPGLGIMLGEKEKTSLGICDPNNKYYKTTCKKLKGYMTDANNLMKNTKIIDITKLQTQDPIPDCENHFSENILYCGLLGNDSYYTFLNTVYNEYFRYKLFLSYYSFYIYGYDYSDNIKAERLDILQENQEKIYQTQDQLLKSKQAISMSFYSLSEIAYSFPLHVGFLMYHEDAEYFNKNISKIYTPIRTLYDKLRNVQIKEQ